MADTTNDSVNVTITATTAQMRAELALAQSQTRALNAEVKALSDQMVAAGAVSDNALKSALSAATTEAAASAARVKELETALKTTDGTIQGMHGSVSTATREFRALFDELSSGRTRQTPGTLAIIAQRVLGLGPAALVATGAVGGLIAAFGYLAIEMERAAGAAEAGQAAFAFKGLDVSKQELDDLTQRIINMKTGSASAAEAILRSFSGIKNSTSSLREELVTLIPAYQKATGEDAQKSGEALASIFTDLDKNGKKFLESLNQTPEVTKALNDFNDAIDHGDTAQAEAIVLQQLQAATDRVGKAAQENEGWWSSFMKTMAQSYDTTGAVTEAINKEANALKALGQQAANNPTTQPKTAESREKFMTDLEGMRNDNSRTQAQITREQIAAYDQRIGELRKYGQDTAQAERERARLVAEAQRQSGQEAIQVTREQNSAINADDTRSKIQQLQSAISNWSQLLASHKLTADQQLEVERSKNEAIAELNRAQHQQEQGIAKTDAETEIEISRLKLQTQLSLLDTDFAAHKVNADQKYQTMVQLTQKLADLDIQQLENEKKAYQAGTVAFEEAANKIKIAKERLNADLARLDHQHTVDAMNENRQENTSWQGMVRGIEQAEQSMVQNLLRGRVTFAQAAIQVAGNLAQNEIVADLKAVTTRLLLAKTAETQKQALEQGGMLYHLFAENQKTAATAVGTTTRDAIQSTSSDSFLGMIGRMLLGWLGFETEKTAASAASAVSEVATQTSVAIAAHAAGMAYAGEAAAAAMASVSAIPFVGWAMAPGVGDAVFAEAMGFQLISAAGGMLEVPSDGTIIKAHAKESVLPANIAGPMRDFFSNGGADSGAQGGDVHVHISAIDTQTGMQFLMDNIGTVQKALSQRARIGDTTLRDAVRPK